MNGIRTNGSRITPLAVASGAIASFDAQVAAPLKILKADINPVQAGSGDPYPPGGGKNKFNLDRTLGVPSPSGTSVSPRVMSTDNLYKGLTAHNYYYDSYASYTNNGSVLKVTSSNNVNYGVGFPIQAKPSTTYTLSYVNSGCFSSVGLYDSNWNFISRVYSPTSDNPKSFTTTNDTAYCVVVFSSATVDVEGTVSNIQLEEGSSATAYAPYSNIRPISGWDEIKITNESGEIFEAANIVATESEIKAYYDTDLVLKAGTYVFSTDATDTVTLIGAQYYSGSWNNIFTQIGTSRKFTLSRSGKCHFRAELRGSGDLSSNTVSLKQLDERTIELPDTVYGGKLDVLKGEGNKEWSDKFTIDGSVSVFNVSQSAGVYYISVRTDLTGVNTTSSNKTVISDKMKTSTGLATDNHCYITNGGATLVCVLSDQTITTKEQANQWFTDNPTSFCYKLATPTALAAEPISMDAYAGSNKITTDSGNTTACYLKGVTT